MRRCPACTDLLYRRSIEGVEVDGCPSCGGVWLDRGELHALVSTDEGLRALDRTFPPGPRLTPLHPPTRACPRCGVALAPIEYDRFRGVRLDNCPSCDGLWLDHGEATEIADRVFGRRAPRSVRSSALADADSEEVLGSPIAPMPSALGLSADELVLDTGRKWRAPEGQPAAPFSPRLQPAATAPVRASMPLEAGGSGSAFWDALSLADALQVRQRHSGAELLFGVECRNKYEIRWNGRQVGFAAEQGRGLGDLFMRWQLGHWRTFSILAFDAGGAQVLTLHHPFRFYFHEIEVMAPGGRRLGKIQRRFSILHKHFDVFDASGVVVMSVRSPLWTPWTFTFRQGNRGELGQIRKRWSGFLSEAFTDRDDFAVNFGQGLSGDERLLMLAAALFIDLMYFEDRAR